jgi:hypothetical protein
LEKWFDVNTNSLSPISQIVDNALFSSSDFFCAVIFFDEILDMGFCVLNAFIEIVPRQLWQFCVWMPLITKDG